MHYHIRRSGIPDTAILGRVHSQAWQETYADLMPADVRVQAGSVERRTAIRRDMFANSTSQGGHFLVEDSDGHIVGFGDCGPACEVKEFAVSEIYTVYLLRLAQGRGLGKKLMLLMLTHLARCGFANTALHVLTTNEAALRFYQGLGGREISRNEKDFFGTILPSAIYLWDDLKKFI